MLHCHAAQATSGQRGSSCVGTRPSVADVRSAVAPAGRASARKRGELRKMYGQNIPAPSGYLITRWSQDPFSLGS